jgi:hypothetical protein
MLDAGRAAFRAAKPGCGRARRANDQLYTSHELSFALPIELRPAALAECSESTSAVVAPALPPFQPSLPLPASPSLEGRWKLRAAEDLRADGTVAPARGEHPVGTIVVERGAHVQIMSSDTPSFAQGNAPVTDQMKARCSAVTSPTRGRARSTTRSTASR